MAGVNFKRCKSFSGLLDCVLEFLWLAMIFALPLLFLPIVQTTFELPKVVFFRSAATIMLILWIAKILLDGKMRLVYGKKMCLLMIFGSAFAVIYVLATIFSVAPVLSVFGWYPRFGGLYTSFCYVIFGVIVLFNLRSEKQLHRLIVAIIASTGFASALALFQVLRVNFLNFWSTDIFLGRAYFPLGHPDFLGGFLAITLPVVIARMAQCKNHLFSAIAVVLSLSALYFTLSRSAYLGLFVGLVLFLLIVFYRQRKWKLFVFTTSLPVLAGLMVILINIYPNITLIRNTPALNRLVFHGESMRSIQTRLAIWPAALQQILNRPLLGYGPETFAITFPFYAPTNLNHLEDFTNIPDRSHNEILDIANQTGIFGSAAFVLFLIAVFIQALRQITTMPVRKAYLYIGILSGILALLVTNLFGFSITVTWVYFTIFLVLIFGFIAKKELFIPIILPKTVKIILFLLISIGALANSFLQDLQLVKADYYYKQSIVHRTSNEMQKAAFDIEKAIKLSPLQSQYHLSLVENAVHALSAYTLSADSDVLFILKNARRALVLRGYDAFSHLSKAKFEAAIAKQNQDKNFEVMAYGDFEQAAIKAPNYATIYLEWGKLLLFFKKPQVAIEKFEKYLSLVPQYYLWKDALISHSQEEQNKYRIFYKLHPDFDMIFTQLAEAYEQKSRAARDK